MTETVFLVMPATTLARSAASRASRARRLQSGQDRDRALASIHKAESRLHRIEAQARERARALGLSSDAAIAARAQFLARESGGALHVIEAVDQARAEAGLPPHASRRAGAADVDIVARARRLMAESGGTLGATAAVDKARAELATLASKGGDARAWEAMERRHEQHKRVEEALGDTAAALERRLMTHARELIAAARRAIADLLIHEAQQGCRDATYEPSRFPVAVPYPSPHRATPAYVVVTSSDLDTSRNKASVSGLSWISRIADDPFKARELAIRAREAMEAITPLFDRKPDHGPARRILEGAGALAA